MKNKSAAPLPLRLPARIALFAAVVLAAAFAVKDVVGGTNPQGIDYPYTPILRAFAASRLALAAIAALIAAKRAPTSRDFVLFVGLIGLSLDFFWYFVPLGVVWAAATLASTALGIGIAAFALYASEDIAAIRSRRTFRAIGVAAGTAIACAGFAQGVFLTQNALDGWDLANRIRWIALAAASVAIEWSAVAGYRSAPERNRQRALLVVAGFAPLLAGNLVHAVSILVTDSSLPLAEDADVVGNLLSALILTYGAVTRRLIDVEFFINESIAWGFLGSVLLLLDHMADEFVLPLVKAYVHGVPALAQRGESIIGDVEAVATFAAFVALTRAHEAVSEVVRGFVFRHREEHLAALRAFAEDEIVLLEPQRVGAALVGVAVRHAQAASAALYLRDGSGFALAASSSPGAAPRVGAHDAVVPESRRPCKLADGGLSLPMVARDGLIGFLRCGPKPDGIAFASDESRLLATAAREAGVAFTTLAPANASATPARARGRRRRRRA